VTYDGLFCLSTDVNRISFTVTWYGKLYATVMFYVLVILLSIIVVRYHHKYIHVYI